MKRIDIIGLNGNDGLHYEQAHMWLFAGDGYEEWDFDGFVAFTCGGDNIFIDKAIAGSPVPRALRFYTRLNLPELPGWTNEE
jgi:hypothetical protein